MSPVVWSLSWFHRDGEAFAGELEAPAAAEDDVRAALRISADIPLDGEFLVTADAAPEVARLWRHAIDLDQYEYFVGARTDDAPRSRSRAIR